MKIRVGLEALWLVLSVICAIGAFRGGDTSILCGWAFLVLTFPFWLAWQTYAYDPMLRFASKNVADLMGVSLSLVIALVVWWHVVPLLLRRARAHSKQHASS